MLVALSMKIGQHSSVNLRLIAAVAFAQLLIKPIIHRHAQTEIANGIGTLKAPRLIIVSSIYWLF